MDFRHTIFPKDIANQLKIEFNEIDRANIQRTDIDIYIKQFLAAKDIAEIQKLISCIGISLQDQRLTKRRIFELSGIIPYLIELARKQITPRLTIEITCILITTSFPPITENGIIELYAELLESNVQDVQNIAMKGFIMVVQSRICRRRILFTEVFDSILKAQISNSKKKIKCLYLLCETYPYFNYNEIKRCLEYFCQCILNDSDVNMQYLGLQALNQLEGKIVQNENFTKLLLRYNIFNRLFFLIDHDNPHIKIEALKTVVKTVQSGIFGIEQIIQAGFIKRVPQYFQCKNSKITEQVFQILSIIAKGSQKLMQEVMYIDQIFDQLLLGAGSQQWQTLTYVAQVLTNSVSNCEMQDLQFLMDKGLFKIYKEILGCNVDILTLHTVQSGVLQVLEKEKQQNQNCYLNELKQLELEKTIYKCQQAFPQMDEDWCIYNEIAKLL